MALEAPQLALGASTLLAREEIAERTIAVHFAKPRGFAFKPGQAIDLILPGGEEAPTDATRHAFSIVSAPAEPRLTIATRLRDSAYKRALAALPPGSALQVDGPFGSLTLHRDRARAAVFIAGGIGITPFISILRNAALDDMPRSLALLYANHRPEDAPFIAELHGLEKRLAAFRFVPTMTRMSASRLAWRGETRRVDADLVRASVAGLASPVYYVAGPPALVGGVRKVLAESGIDDDDIRSEEFHGY